MRYRDGTSVQVGDRVQYGRAMATVEELIIGDQIKVWGLKRAAFMLCCEECGRVLIESGTSDWEDILPLRHA